jgi:uncharacterized membrane protein
LIVRRVLAVVATVAAIGYPVLVYVGLLELSPRWFAVLLLPIAAIVLGMRMQRSNVPRGPILGLFAALFALLACSLLWNDPRFLFALPVLINVSLLVSFAVTLRTDMPMIERFARMQTKTLSEPQRKHCRTWTWVWCGFFLANGATTALLAAYASAWAWTFYTGLLAYGAMGLLFSIEYVVRKIRFREYGRWPHDRALAALFPPKPS